jgi:hypothetical protein
MWAERASCTCRTPSPGEGRSMAFFFCIFRHARQLPVSILILLLAACSPAAGTNDSNLELPTLRAADYHWIAARIFENETRGQTQYLTYWGSGEDFPSLGIGHFIWFPAGVDAPFDESFPAMMNFVAERSNDCSPRPAWLQGIEQFDAPWTDKLQFDAEQQTERMLVLREWLAATAAQQAQYIVASFKERWNGLQLPAAEKAPLTALLRSLLGTSKGLFAVIDYYNFKGLGSNPRERYAGEGWGLVQVLSDISVATSSDDPMLVARFSEAAAKRLELRVENAPPQRNEGRWLEGWHKRVAEYQQPTPELAVAGQSRFRVRPYLQRPSADGMTVTWFSELASPGSLLISTQGSDDRTETSTPQLACELAYHLAEFRDLDLARSLPYRHEITVNGLLPGKTYQYEVVQDGEIAKGNIQIPDGVNANVRFAVYGDSETEPESTGKHALWPRAGEPDRRYLVDQTDGYAANLQIITAERPNFVAIAGDLVESGGEQRDWDEFWHHNATLAASVPLVPARGNHDYYGGPGDLGGYSNNATRRAIDKYESYFSGNAWYVLDYGPIGLVIIDPGNGTPERTVTDSNWYLSGEAAGGVAPAWQEGSEQLRWLQSTLAILQTEKRFTFVLFHAAPYSSGVHGRPPGTGEGENFASGIPLRALTPVFQQFGVDAVFNGHDEMYEHSAVDGLEERADGSRTPHTIHYFTVGIGGDGLRGRDAAAENPNRVFLADEGAAEVRADNGVLLQGGRHYGHMTVAVSKQKNGHWQALIEPVYAFPRMNSEGDIDGFERRIYDDVVFLENERDD